MVLPRTAAGVLLALGLVATFRAQNAAEPLPPELTALARGIHVRAAGAADTRRGDADLGRARGAAQDRRADLLRGNERARRLPDHDAEGAHPPRRRDAGLGERLRGLDPQGRVQARGHQAPADHARPHRSRGGGRALPEAVERPGRRDGPRVRAPEFRRQDRLSLRRCAGLPLPAGHREPPDQGRRLDLARQRPDDGPPGRGPHEGRHDLDHEGRRTAAAPTTWSFPAA